MQAVLKAKRMIGELGSRQLQKILWQCLGQDSCRRYCGSACENVHHRASYSAKPFLLNAFHIANLGPRKRTDAGAKQSKGKADQTKKLESQPSPESTQTFSMSPKPCARAGLVHKLSKNEKNGKNVEYSPRSKMAEKNRKKWKIGPIFYFSATFPLLDWGEFSTFFPFFPILEFGLSSSPARLQPKPPKISENRQRYVCSHFWCPSTPHCQATK